jgi:hypothetical protein
MYPHYLQQHNLLTSFRILFGRGADYVYQPLPNTSSIRLLELQRGVGDSPLKVTIHLSPYPSTQKYHALSYTWGEPGRLHELYCTGGSQLQITTNLRSALRSLRLRNQPRWLWVDAVCINRKDNAEKSRQIPLMPGIYRYSEETVVYLGEAEEHSDALLKLAEDRTSAIASELKLTREDDPKKLDESKVCDFILANLRPKNAPMPPKKVQTWWSNSSN